MKKLILLLLAVVSLSSCGAYKRLAYLQDMSPDSTYVVTQFPETRIGVGDELAISVLSSQPLLAAPFNIRPESARMDSLSGVTPGASLYTVDEKGRINFPVLGPVMVEGMTLNELSTTLVDEIRATNFLKDPVVTVEFNNFEILVLGEANVVGRQSYPNGKVNIFQLLADVGDLTEDARRDRVWVIRTTSNSRKIFTLNMKSKDVYDSPAYFLQQNDMVYVAPRDGKIDKKTESLFQWISTPLTFVSTIFSGFALVRSFSR